MAQFITTQKQPGGYAIITMAKEPVNSFDTAMWQALHAAVKAAEADPSMKGVIITSGLQKDIFTGGWVPLKCVQLSAVFCVGPYRAVRNSTASCRAAGQTGALCS